MSSTPREICHAIGDRILDHIRYWQEQVKTGKCDADFAIEGVVHSVLTLFDNEQLLDLEGDPCFALAYQLAGKKRWNILDTHLHDEVYSAQTRQDQK